MSNTSNIPTNQGSDVSSKISDLINIQLRNIEIWNDRLYELLYEEEDIDG